MRRVLFLSCLLFSASLLAAENPTPIGDRVESFKLDDYRGKSHSLDDLSDKKLIVVAFLGTECPLAKLYGPRLAKLDEEFASRGVAFIGINSNVQDSITEIASYARRHEIGFPILKDVGNRVADQLGAERTPEVFVLDQVRIIRYWGRIDDQYGVGYIRDEPRQQDLKLALDQLLSGESVSNPETESVGCHIGRVREPQKDATVTYANQIVRILQKRCVECHRDGEIAPFELTDYNEVVGWAEMIEEVVREQRMPPWHADPSHGEFANERLLTEDEKQLIYRWVAEGAPLGDAKLIPESPQFAEGWQLPRKPDAEFFITDKPYTVKAEGEVKYQWFSVDTGFKEDKWVKAAEILPGNRAVVHHVLAFVRKPGERRSGGGGDGHLVGYVPGLRNEPLPDGMAKLIPAGSQLVFQVHYTPVGTVQQDRSKIGLVFADLKEVTHLVKTTQAANPRFRIPPNDGNYQVEATSSPAPQELLLLSFMPHMHLRGKSFLYEAEFADGSKEPLLNVPAYDFNWQTSYQLAEPMRLTKGTRIHCVAHFDNSEKNLNNPDPTKTVGWGDQTWDEMMIGYFDIAVPIKPADKAEASKGESKKQKRVSRLFLVLDKNGDGKISRSEVPARLQRVFDRVDKDDNDEVSHEELTAAADQLGV